MTVVAYDNRHETVAGRPFWQTRPAAQRETDHEDSDRQAIQATVRHALGQISYRNDRRREPRTLFIQPVLVTFELTSDGANEEYSLLATTIDISSGGMGLLAPRAFPCQQIVLHVLDVSIVAEVRWCRKVNDRLFRCGLRFVKMLT